MKRSAPLRPASPLLQTSSTSDVAEWMEKSTVVTGERSRDRRTVDGRCCRGCACLRGIYSSRERARAILSQKEHQRRRKREEEEAPPLFIFLAETSAPVRGGR